LGARLPAGLVFRRPLKLRVSAQRHNPDNKIELGDLE
jgi:hypothetical protein